MMFKDEKQEEEREEERKGNTVEGKIKVEDME